MINGDNVSTVSAEDGPIPTVRKVLKDIEDIGTNQFNVIFTAQNIITQNYRTYLVDTSLVPITATLPANATQGQFVMIFDYVGQASTNNITVNTTDSSNINGSATYTITTDKAFVGFWRDATEWKAIDDRSADSLTYRSQTIKAALDSRVLTFDSVAAMKASVNLVIGDTVRTTGYYAANDGGGATYKIVAAATGTDDGGSYHDLTGISGQAQLIHDGVVNVKQFGAKGDGVTDDTVRFQSVLDSGFTPLFVPAGNYIVGTIRVKADTILQGAGDVSIITTSASQGIQIGTASVTTPIAQNNVQLKDLKVIKTSATFGPAIDIVGGSSDGRLTRVTVSSQHIGIRLGRDDLGADSATPYRWVIEDCNIVESYYTGIHMRVNATDYTVGVSENPNHIIKGNRVVCLKGATSNNVGIETWTDGTLVQGNKVIATDRSGLFGGVTAGAARFNQIIGNYIYGYDAGIEVGNADENDLSNIVVSGNTLESCARGIAVTSSGNERDILLSNNNILFRDEHTGVYGISLQGCKTATISGGSISYMSDGDITLDASRAGSTTLALYSDTNFDSVAVTGLIINNFERAIQSAATSGNNFFSNCIFSNIKWVVLDSGGSPYNFFNNCEFRDCGTIRVNKFGSVTNSRWINDPTFTYAGKAFMECLESANCYTINTGNLFNANVIGATIRSNGDYIGGGSGYNRAAVEKRDEVFVTRNVSTWTDVKTQFSNAGVTIPYDTYIQTWSTNFSFIKRQTAKNVDITDGGDVIENWGP